MNMIHARYMHSNMACARGMIMHLAEPKSPCQSFAFRLTTKFIHENCGCGSIPLNVFRCRIPALIPAARQFWLQLSNKTGGLAGLSASLGLLLVLSHGTGEVQVSHRHRPASIEEIPGLVDVRTEVRSVLGVKVPL